MTYQVMLCLLLAAAPLEKEDPRDAKIRELEATVKLLQTKIGKQEEEIRRLRANSAKRIPKAAPRDGSFAVQAAIQRQKRIEVVQKRIQRVSQELRRIRHERQGNPIALRTAVKQPKKELAELSAELKRHRNPKEPFVLDGFEETLAVGQTAPVRSAKITQIQDNDNMLAELPVWYEYKVVGRGQGPTTLHRMRSQKTLLIWIGGIDTTGLTDGEYAQINRTLRVVGTKNYGTVLGAPRTVFLLEPMNIRSKAWPKGNADAAQ